MINDLNDIVVQNLFRTLSCSDSNMTTSNQHLISELNLDEKDRQTDGNTGNETGRS